jgi:hypothetical protein
MIIHLGRTYRVVATGHHTHPYLLIGRRGAQYYLLRSHTHPERLFAVGRRTSLRGHIVESAAGLHSFCV